MLRQIGAGSLGPVFRAEDPASQTAVVIKVLRLHLSADRARRVADELALLQDRVPAHPGIAPLVKAGLRETEPFIVSAFAPGDPLDAVLRELGAAPLGEALPRLVQIAAGLDFCADASIWHGGLHPPDVLVAPGETAVVGVGIAQILERVGVTLPVRRPYTAPEVVAGRPTSPATDQFALAAMAFEWLYGQRIAGPATARVEVPPLEGADDHAMAAAFTTALAPDPEARFESSTAFVAALAEAVEKPAAAPRPTPSRVRRSVPLTSIVPALPDADIAATDTAIGPAGTDSVLAADLDALRAEAPVPVPPVAPPAPRRARTATVLAAVLLGAILVGGGLGYWFGLAPAAATGAAGITGADGAIGAAGAPAPVDVPAQVTPASAVGPAAAMAAPAATTPAAAALDGTAPDAAPSDAAASAAAAPDAAAPNAAAPDAAAPEASGQGGEAHAGLAAPRRDAIGRVLVRSTPAGAEVMVNGELRGRTPLALRDLPLGTYVIAVSRPGHASEQHSVLLTAARPSQSLEIGFTGTAGPRGASGATSGAAAASSTTAAPGAAIGSLMIESRPVGATVFVDGRVVGVTPMMLERLAPGAHAVRLERAGYHAWTATVNVVAGELTRLAASLAGGNEEE